MALRWLAEFLTFAQDVMVPFTPRLIPAILPNLAHHVAMIQSAAIRTNKLLLNVVQNLPSPLETPPTTRPIAERPQPSRIPRSPTPTTSTTNSRQSTLGSQVSQASREVATPDILPDVPPLQRHRTSNAELSLTPRPAAVAEISASSSEPSRPHSPVSLVSQPGMNGNLASSQQQEETDLFDYQATVNELTIQFLSEFEETRVAALKWLIMLHQKAPKKVCFTSKIFPLITITSLDPRHGRRDISGFTQDIIRQFRGGIPF